MGKVLGNSTIPYYLIQHILTLLKTIWEVKRQFVCPIYNKDNLDKKEMKISNLQLIINFL